MGGMRALEWAVTEPDRVERLFLLACPAAASADQIAWAAPQLAAIRERPGLARRRLPRPRRAGEGPHLGLGIARRMAHLSYRSGLELRHPVRPAAQPGEDPRQRRALRGRSPTSTTTPRSSCTASTPAPTSRLTEMMNAHDVGRGRGGAAGGAGPGHARARWSPASARTGSTRWSSRRSWPRGIPGAGELRLIESPYGHDGVPDRGAPVEQILGELLPRLELVARAAPPPRGAARARSRRRGGSAPRGRCAGWRRDPARAAGAAPARWWCPSARRPGRGRTRRSRRPRGCTAAASGASGRRGGRTG